MSQTLTLREAGIKLGVSGKALKRLIRSGVLPEAHKVSSSSGRSWVIPIEALPIIAERQGWVIDLTGDTPLLDVDDSTDLATNENSARERKPTDIEAATAPDPSKQDAALAPEYETIRLERLGPTTSILADSTPSVAHMADVYDLNTVHPDTGHLTNGNGLRRDLENNRTGTEDPSANETKLFGAKTEMNRTPISHTEAGPSDSKDEIRTGQPPLPTDEKLDEIDLSAGTDLAAVEMGALIPHRARQESPVANDADSPSLADVLDVALLDRLLGAQEEKANALAKAHQTENSLTALNERNEQALSELEVVRQEADVTADRLREERMARIVADAKVAELRDRVIREMTLADSEKQARVEATMRNIQAERDNANAYASMGWMARRRFRRLNRHESSDD